LSDGTPPNCHQKTGTPAKALWLVLGQRCLLQLLLYWMVVVLLT
jgi:hypothetical protein